MGNPGKGWQGRNEIVPETRVSASRGSHAQRCSVWHLLGQWRRGDDGGGVPSCEMELYNRCDWLKAPDSIVKLKPASAELGCLQRHEAASSSLSLLASGSHLHRWWGSGLSYLSTSVFTCVSSSITSPSASLWQGSGTASRGHADNPREFLCL